MQVIDEIAKFFYTVCWNMAVWHITILHTGVRREIVELLFIYVNVFYAEYNIIATTQNMHYLFLSYMPSGLSMRARIE